MSAAAREVAESPHVPVLLDAILTMCAPVHGVWLDGTFGAGGHSRGLLDAGADRVIAVDRDPTVLEMAADWAEAYGGRLDLVEGTFSELDRHANLDLDGVVLDLGVSSMQLDQAERGFSFLFDGPLDMRMSGTGRSAADIVGSVSETVLADILFHYGEERAARAIARAIVNRRKDAPIETTRALAQIIEAVMPRRKPGASHPATRTFQALRIAVNDELTQLAAGLEAAERSLRPGGWLAVVSFHSLEDRIVKRFFQERSGRGRRASRHQPAGPAQEARFVARNKAVFPSATEVARNPRARSARLRLGRRTAASAGTADRSRLGLPREILP